ncbi:hypothetical protein A4X13_0g3789 [Tilletia indica]|uniref:TATA box binding protein associated factor (TAF) histone-like fold domain-containing protein n=1 Tax=Tilletia indica TaxID=43049 RepID=A0A177TCY1_9BASI|nr:hypothetical protein A4X13_0g3789 [Tilletia indica]
MPPRAGEQFGAGASSSASSSVLYPTDSIRDAAESLGIAPLRDNVAVAFAADVEYRLRDIIQEAAKYMRHAKRGALSTQDVELALRARNVEPIYGFLPFSTTTFPRSGTNNAAVGGTGTVGHPSTLGPTFRRVQTPTGPIHYVADDEIDFEKILDAAPKLAKGKGVGWEAHWLAIEGVVPDVPQNVPQRTPTSTSAFGAAGAAAAGRLLGASGPLPDSGAASSGVTANGASGSGTSGVGTSTMGAGTAQIKPLIKHVLSRELQLYFERLTNAIVSPPASADVEDDEEDEEDAPSGQEEGDPDIVMVDATGQKIGGPTKPGDSGANAANAAAQSSDAQEALTFFSRRSSGNTVRDAGLASLRSDPGLHPLLPYLVQWIGEKVVACLRGQWSLVPSSAGQTDTVGQDRMHAPPGDTVALRVMLNVIHAMSVNESLYVEPYLHQLLPTVLSVLLCASLSPPMSTATAFGQTIQSSAGGARSRLPSGSKVTAPAAATAAAHNATYQLRTYASALLAHLVQSHARAYPGLRPRIVRTLLKALTAGLPTYEESVSLQGGMDDEDGLDFGATNHQSGGSSLVNGPKESPGTKLGALLGLRRIGREAARLALFGPEADVARSVDDDDDDGGSLRQRRRSDLLKRLGEWSRRYERSSAYGMGQLSRLRVKEEVVALTHEVKACIVTIFPTSPSTQVGPSGAGDIDVQAMEQPLAISLQAAIGPFWADKFSSDANVQRSLVGRVLQD